ncbi:MAG: hypothetical protein WCP28_18280 [Actinomycetes bacterium]
MSGTDYLDLLLTAHLPELQHDADPDAATASWILEHLENAHYSNTKKSSARDLLDMGVPHGVDALIVRLPGHTIEPTDDGDDREFGIGLNADPHDIWVACRAESWAPAAPLPTHLIATRLGLILAVFAITAWDTTSDGRATPAAGWRLDPTTDPGRAYPVGAGTHRRSRRLTRTETDLVHPDYWCPDMLIRYPAGRRTSYRIPRQAGERRASRVG